MTDLLLALGLLIPVVLLYIFVLGLAKKDIAAGQASTPTYAILLIPLVGPLVYLLFRSFRK